MCVYFTSVKYSLKAFFPKRDQMAPQNFSQKILQTQQLPWGQKDVLQFPEMISCPASSLPKHSAARGVYLIERGKKEKKIKERLKVLARHV